MTTMRKQIALFWVIIILFFILTRFIPMNDVTLHWITDLSWTFFSGATSWACFQVARASSGQHRTSWYYFTAANTFWLLGILIWDYLELIQKITTPFPAYSDIGFSMMAPFFAIGLIYLQRDSNNLSSSLLQYSKLGILITCLVISHLLIFAEPLRQSNESNLYIFVALSYPILYISCFIYALQGLWKEWTKHTSYVFTLFILSIFMHTTTNSIYAYSLLEKTYAAGSYIDILWLLAFGLMYFAATIQKQVLENTKVNDAPDESKPSRISRVIDDHITPIAIIFLAFITFLFQHEIKPEISQVLLYLFITLALLIALKEWLIFTQEQKLINNAVESEKNFIDLTANIPGITYQFLVTQDGQQSFPYVSPNSYLILGISDKEIMNNAQLWIDQIHPDDLASFDQTVLDSYKNNCPWFWEGRMKTASGNYGWYRGNSVPRKLNDGSRLWNGIVTDISKYLEQQASLTKDKILLEQKVKERTKDLLLAKEKAERANAAKTEFLSHMGHELRTPLNAIIGFSQLLSMEDLTEEHQSSVTEINIAGHHQLALINDLLDLSSIESRNSKINFSAVCAWDILDSSLRLIKPLASENNIKIDVSQTNFENYIFVDALKLKQILINLLSNAIKYNRKDGHISVHSKIIKSGMLKITITDNGLGISKEKHMNVFEEFNRLGNEKSEIQGSGIGLAVSRKLINLMEGDIGFESKVGEGSSFWITCKLSDPNLQEIEKLFDVI